MKNFRSAQVPTISPNLLHQSSDFKLPPNQNHLGKRCLSTEEWTDEKHSKYLKSMEASFVNQLYNSKQVLGWRPPKATLSHSTAPITSQWKDMGDGRWKEIKYEREKAQTSRKNEGHHERKAKPWIQQVSCSSGSVVEESVTSRDTSKVRGTGPRIHIHSALPHHMLFNDIEMTDQNFVDEQVAEC
ncbi:cold-regulated protein 27-like isoform X2 [Prosopis cineraria]|uniref:cold-regulated protein 27-like isoform X2 n=1 Tax=Prosopis cineraria TaxID=364024 RepID=UPI00240F0F7F|nr:cold-regulated protein 27-like isoform X2 [Prosopis cineraria]